MLRALAAKLAEIARLTQLGDHLLASRASRGASEAYGAALLLAPDDDELVAKKALADRMVAAAQLKEEGAARQALLRSWDVFKLPPKLK